MLRKGWNSQKVEGDLRNGVPMIINRDMYVVTFRTIALASLKGRKEDVRQRNEPHAE